MDVGNDVEFKHIGELFHGDLRHFRKKSSGMYDFTDNVPYVPN